MVTATVAARLLLQRGKRPPGGRGGPSGFIRERWTRRPYAPGFSQPGRLSRGGGRRAVARRRRVAGARRGSGGRRVSSGLPVSTRDRRGLQGLDRRRSG